MPSTPVNTLPPAQRAAAKSVGSDAEALPGADGSVYLYRRTEHRVTRWLVDPAGNVQDTASFHLGRDTPVAA